MIIQNISFGGLSTSPSDTQSPAGDLAWSKNVINEDGSLRPIGEYEELFNIEENEKIIVQHITSTKSNFLTIQQTSETAFILRSFYLNNTDRSYYSFQKDITAYGEFKDYSILGNLIFFAFEKKSFFLRFNEGSYSFIDDMPPLLDINFSNTLEVKDLKTKNFFNVNVAYLKNLESGYSGYIISDKDELLKQKIMGDVNEMISKAKESGYFVFPYFVRAAYRLYDGTLAFHSAPVLMLPSFQYAPYIPCKIIGEDTGNTPILRYRIQLGLCRMLAKINTVIPDEWKDIIQSIDIFVSNQISPFESDGGIKKTTPIVSAYLDYQQNYGIARMGHSPYDLTGTYSAYTYENEDRFKKIVNEAGVDSPCDQVVALPLKKWETYLNEIQRSSQLYLLKSIPVSKISSTPFSVSDDYDNLNLINTNELMEDDYISNFPKTFEKLYTFNARLNGIGLKMKYFQGYPLLSTQSYQSGDTTLQSISDYYVVIEDGGERIIKRVEAEIDQMIHWLYYPSVNAKEIIIKHKFILEGNRVSYVYSSYPLVPHPGLNGAYYFLTAQNPASLPHETLNDYISYPSKIATSKINNSFVFPPENINTVGNGTLLQLASTTKPLSQGQFGQFPLYVFSTDGVFAMTVNSEGGYESKQVVSRDVCNNVNSITQIDGAIIFSTINGLKLLSGTEVISISASLEKQNDLISNLPRLKEFLGEDLPEQISFLDYMKQAFVSYDYVEQRLFVYNPDKPYTLVYSLKSKLWTTYQKQFTYPINSYPEQIVVSGSKAIKLCGAMKTFQPMKFYAVTRPTHLNTETLKTVRKLIVRSNMSNVKVGVWGTRDNIHYFGIRSGINQFSCFGTPYKSFVICVAGDISVQEYLSHLSISADEKYTNMLR